MEKGQFEPFKMMIGAIVALLILLIILGAIRSFEEFKINVSKERFLEGLENAVQQPNNDILVVENLLFDKGTVYTKDFLARRTGLEGQCVEILAPSSSSFTVDSQRILVNYRIETNFYAQCTTNLDPASFCDSTCEICCKFSFSKPITP
ncbi:MAG: hypothetical protein J4224_03670 [Candidatus Diapherotrites archaeon]|uniref:Uncharacterized protein n=1 Tax=Candidatus Iainarchaeum sp. TaxID=3101447 RepID=A0A7J4IWF2_9ARCH|nr:MAG: hypothetical protein QT03_C0001G0726 [archaeon GW2011_AR10]MBS3059491.1 hypothetical protein [Candidatus Diapherotrites archaeon]HIH08067.1 hypothetical protein [Candidatus Diapherotrites archaeon]